LADGLTLRNNHFTHRVIGANKMTWGSDTLGAITVGVSLPEGVNGFPNSFQNRNVTIEGNRIDDSYIYAIFLSNADSIRITGNVIGQTFIGGSAFDASGRFGVHPDSATLVGRSRNAQISGNTLARGRVIRRRSGPDLRQAFCPCGKQQACVTTCREIVGQPRRHWLHTRITSHTERKKASDSNRENRLCPEF
jgi:parallel beta-helix repeat protein